MAGALYLIDSNVVLRWVQPSDPDYSAVASALETLAERGDILCYTSQNLAEFWNTCTRPTNRNGYGLSPSQTDRRAEAFESRLRLLPDGLAVHNEWRRLLVQHNVSGVQVHDARLVAAMHVHGVKHILTFNEKDFARYSDIEAIHPRTLVAIQP
ncbi:MAG: PIN domain-containing protein [Candidatus Korobacteraceae bacterium]|jgi:predicted nucleic acid-binding protein